MEEISDLIFSDENEANTLAGHQLRMLMDYSFENPDQPGEHLNWLTRYAVDYRYRCTGSPDERPRQGGVPAGDSPARPHLHQ